MKKITFLSLCLLFTSLLVAQVNTYSDQAAFESAYTANLLTEDFSGGPAGPEICGTIISSAGNDCFPEGELIEGFELTASENSEVIFLPTGFLPSNNESPRLGANTGINFTIVSFTGSEAVYAAGFSIHTDNNVDFNYRVFGASNNLLYDEVVPFTDFYGVIAAEPIGRIEIEAVNDGGELFGDLAFGTENVLGISENVDLTLDVYPNPVIDILNIQSKQPISTITIYNFLGQSLQSFKNIGTQSELDLSGLESGIYVLMVTSFNGTVGNIKVLKK